MKEDGIKWERKQKGGAKMDTEEGAIVMMGRRGICRGGRREIGLRNGGWSH